MASDFPTALDSFSNPTASSTTAAVDHAAQHANANDAIEAIEAKLGISASTPAAGKVLRATGTGTSAWGAVTSADVSGVTGSGNFVLATSPTIAGATLSSAIIANPTLTVDSIAEYSSGVGVTIDGVLLKDGVLGTNTVPTAAIQAGAVTSTKAADGFLVQVASSGSTAVATGTTTIPRDDTIPQNTEGTEFMTQAITPKSATNILVIEITAMVSLSSANTAIGAVFQDSTAGAIAAAGTRCETADRANFLAITHRMVAGTTSPTTFKLRCGPPSAGTITFNGEGGSRLFGAITKATFTIWEYKAS